jgi:hypothetical protein
MQRMVKPRQPRITAILIAVALTIAIFLAVWAARDRSFVGARIRRISQKFLAGPSHSSPPDRVLHIVGVRAIDVSDPDAEKSVTLSVTVAKTQQAAVVDDNKVRTDVFFYESVGDKELKLTDANVSYDALAAHDWSSMSPAVYTVDYKRPKNTGTDRKYIGYMVRLYYNEQLQAQYAEPAKLSDLFPPSGLVTSANASAQPPFATAQGFAEYAMKIREQALSKVAPRLFVPTAKQQFPWKTNIVATVFWIGEKRSADTQVPHRKSAWDPNWVANYGGFDDPESSSRRDYIPVSFIPRQNPFYCALPYNDVTHGQFKAEAPVVIPWFEQAYTGPGQSVCWHHWIAIRKGNRTCYAQWEDSGPFRDDHFQYVFGDERPKPNLSHGAGIDVSPAIRDYLGLASTDVIDWQFVDVRDVPPGPWRSYGDNNNFVLARRQMEQKLTQQGGAAETVSANNRSASPSEPAIDAEAHPIIDVKQGYLLGASTRGRWLSAEHSAKLLKPGKMFRVFSLNEELGTAKNGKLHVGEICPEILSVPLTPEYKNGVIAIDASWNVLPRSARHGDSTQRIYIDAVRTFLIGAGIKDPQVKITKLLFVDLNGDGEDEVLISATNYFAKSGERVLEAVAGSYSVVLLRSMVAGKVRTELVAGEVYPENPEARPDLGPPNWYEVSAILDLDGDGKMEVLVNSEYYEGGDSTIYRCSPAKVEKLLSVGCGL